MNQYLVGQLTVLSFIAFEIIGLPKEQDAAAKHNIIFEFPEFDKHPNDWSIFSSSGAQNELEVILNKQQKKKQVTKSKNVTVPSLGANLIKGLKNIKRKIDTSPPLKRFQAPSIYWILNVMLIPKTTRSGILNIMFTLVNMGAMLLCFSSEFMRRFMSSFVGGARSKFKVLRSRGISNKEEEEFHDCVYNSALNETENSELLGNDYDGYKIEKIGDIASKNLAAVSRKSTLNEYTQSSNRDDKNFRTMLVSKISNRLKELKQVLHSFSTEKRDSGILKENKNISTNYSSLKTKKLSLPKDFSIKRSFLYRSCMPTIPTDSNDIAIAFSTKSLASPYKIRNACKYKLFDSMEKHSVDISDTSEDIDDFGKTSSVDNIVQSLSGAIITAGHLAMTQSTYLPDDVIELCD